MVTLKYVTQNGGCLPTFCSFIDSGGTLKKKSYRAKGRTDDISWRMALVVLYSRPPHPPHKFTDKLNWHISCSRNPRPSIITRHQLCTQFKDTALSVPLAAPWAHWIVFFAQSSLVSFCGMAPYYIPPGTTRRHTTAFGAKGMKTHSLTHCTTITPQMITTTKTQYWKALLLMMVTILCGW